MLVVVSLSITLLRIWRLDEFNIIIAAFAGDRLVVGTFSVGRDFPTQEPLQAPILAVKAVGAPIRVLLSRRTSLVQGLG